MDTDSALDRGKDRVITLTGRLAQQTRFPVNPGGAPAQGDRTVFRSVHADTIAPGTRRFTIDLDR